MERRHRERRVRRSFETELAASPEVPASTRLKETEAAFSQTCYEPGVGEGGAIASILQVGKPEPGERWLGAG